MSYSAGNSAYATSNNMQMPLSRTASGSVSSGINPGISPRSTTSMSLNIRHNNQVTHQPTVSYSMWASSALPGSPGSMSNNNHNNNNHNNNNHNNNNHNNNNNTHFSSQTPHFSSKMSVCNLSSAESNREANHTTNVNVNVNNDLERNLASPSLHNSTPVIIPAQQNLLLEDPLLKAVVPALQSRTLMRSHYKATGFCILFVFAVFLLLSPLTYYIALSNYKSELTSYTAEQCVVHSIDQEEYTIPTVCGQSTGYRFQILVTYDNKLFPLCSTKPYSCYNATTSPPSPDPDPTPPGHDKSNPLTNNLERLYEMAVYDDNNHIPPHHKVSSLSLSPHSSQYSQINEMWENKNDGFSCTMCLRNDVSQCFSHLSQLPDAYDDLVIGSTVECYEYTQRVGVNLAYRYFDGTPKQLEGYPYIKNWYIFFIVGCVAFLLISIYYLVKGIGFCDIIDPSYWKRRREKAARDQLEKNQRLAKVEYLKKKVEQQQRNDPLAHPKSTPPEVESLIS